MFTGIYLLLGIISLILPNTHLKNFFITSAYFVFPFLIILTVIAYIINLKSVGKNCKIINLAVFLVWLLFPDNTWRQMIYNDRIMNMPPSEIHKYYDDNMNKWKFKKSFISKKLVPNHGYFLMIDKIACLCFIEHKTSLNSEILPKHQKGRFAERETLLINAYNAFLQSNYQDAYRNISQIKSICKPAVLLVFQYICAQKIGENWKQNLQPNELERLKHALMNDEYTKLLKGELEDV